MQIPKITHQVWIQGWDQLPEKFHSNVNLLREVNPAWTHRTWDHARLRKACEEYGPECAQKFDSYEHFIQQVDFGRYVVLYLYGGVAVDCDMVAIRPLDDIPELDSSELVVSLANRTVIETCFTTMGHLTNNNWFINNAFIVAAPRNPDLKRLIESCINDRTKRADYLNKAYFISTTTGPIRFSTALKDSPMTILYSDVIESEYENEKSIFIHKHELSWTEPGLASIFKIYLFIQNYKILFIFTIALILFYLLK